MMHFFAPVITGVFSIKEDIILGFIAAMLLAAAVQLLDRCFSLRSAFGWIIRHFTLYLLTVFVIVVWLSFWSSVIGSVAPAVCIASTIILIFGFANCLIRVYRNKPFMPRDIAMSLNLGQIASMISPLMVAAVVGSFAVTVTSCVLLYSLAPVSGWPISLRIIAGAFSAVIFAGFLLLNLRNNPLRRIFCLLGADFDNYRINVFGSYSYNGFLIAFLEQIAAPLMPMPDGYSKQEVERIAAKYNNIAQSRTGVVIPPEKLPHIVFVMSESFSDPLSFGMEWSEDPIPFIRSLMNGRAAWRTLCPGYGGGTAHCECEALTGISTALCGDSSPYENRIARRESFPSYVQHFKSAGYRALALHPYNNTMYARPKAYKAIGFDNFITNDKMAHTLKLDHNPYISDGEAYGEVVDMLRGTSKPAFIHLVTMQNHGNYKAGRFSTRIEAKGVSGRTAAALETYAQGLRHTDEATKAFLNDLKSLDRDTVVLFWGDHLPFAYPKALVAPYRLEQYLTPAFCYFTGKTPRINNAVRSPVFFARFLAKAIGLPPRGFDVLLDKLGSRIYGFHMDFTVDRRGILHDGMPDGLSGELLREYLIIQYDLLEGGGWAEKSGFFDIK